MRTTRHYVAAALAAGTPVFNASFNAYAAEPLPSVAQAAQLPSVV